MSKKLPSDEELAFTIVKSSLRIRDKAIRMINGAIAKKRYLKQKEADTD